jgi:DNA-directed RNA polymerase specialized sigma24 family protein
VRTLRGGGAGPVPAPGAVSTTIRSATRGHSGRHDEGNDVGNRRARRREAMAADLVATALPMVWRYARGMTGEEEAARAVVHEAFRLVDPGETAGAPPSPDQLLARARRAVHGGPGTEGAPSRGQGEVPAPGRESAAPSGADEETAGAGPSDPGSASGAAASGLRGGLVDELVALDPDDREALLLLDVLDLGVDRAAELCEVPPSALHERRHRAHGRMVARVVGDDL